MARRATEGGVESGSCGWSGREGRHQGGRGFRGRGTGGRSRTGHGLFQAGGNVLLGAEGATGGGGRVCVHVCACLCASLCVCV